jgi:hypothetical protein
MFKYMDIHAPHYVNEWIFLAINFNIWTMHDYFSYPYISARALLAAEN